MGFPYSWVNTRCANNGRTYTIPIPITWPPNRFRESDLPRERWWTESVASIPGKRFDDKTGEVRMEYRRATTASSQ